MFLEVGVLSAPAAAAKLEDEAKLKTMSVVSWMFAQFAAECE